ncbi:MAG TPA: phage tail tape measure protein [Sedimentisphaerales bacterium]|nr:phage tail tape measure protein [Sedimentisphaerales bacterium]
MPERNLDIKITAKDEASGVISGMQKKMTSVANSFATIGKGMSKYVTAPLVAFGAVAAHTAIDFDKAMMGVNSVVKLSGQAFQDLKEDVLEFSTHTSKSSADVAVALRGIMSTGYQTADAMTILKVSVDAAGNMMTDTETTTRALTSTLAAFGYEASDVTHVADVLQLASNKSAINFELLASTIGNATGIAAAAGISFETLAAALMTTVDAGYSEAEASTAVRALIQSLIKPTDQLAGIIKVWGYESGETALQELGLQKMMVLLNKTTGGSTEEIATLLGNVRAMKAAFALGRGEGQAFADSMDEVALASEGAGEHAKMAEIRHQSWSYQITKMKSELEVFSIRLANLYIPTIIQVVKVLTGWLTTLATLDKEQLQTILTIALVAASIGPVLIGVAKLISAMIAVKNAIAIIKTAMIALNVILAANPIALIAMGIVAAGLAIAAVVKKISDNTREMEKATASASAQAKETTSSYGEYRQSVLDTIRVVNQIHSAVTDETLAQILLEEGLMDTRDAYIHAKIAAGDYAGAMASVTNGLEFAYIATLQLNVAQDKNAQTLQYWDSINDEVMGGLRDMQGELDTTTNYVRESDYWIQQAERNWRTSADGMATAMHMAGQDIQVTMYSTRKIVLDALDSEPVKDQLDKMFDIIEDHNEAVVQIAQEAADERVESQRQLGFEMAQSEQEFQQMHAALLQVGRVKDAADLLTKHQREQALANRDYLIQQQEQKRNNLIKRIAQLTNYHQALSDQNDQTARVLAAELQKNVGWADLGAEAQKTLLDIAYSGASDRLANERDFALKQLEVSKYIAEGSVDAAAEALKAFIELQEAREAATLQELKDAQATLTGWTWTIPPLPGLDLGALAGSGPAGERAAQQATEPATRVMAEVAKDIEEATKSAMQAIKDLVEFDVPAGVEVGLGRVASFLTKAAGMLHTAMEGIDKASADVAATMATATATIVGAFAQFVGLQEGLAVTPELGGLPGWIAGFKTVVDSIVGALEGSAITLDEEGKSAAAMLAGAASSIIGIVKPAIEAMVALADWEPVESLVGKMDSFQRLIGQVVNALEESADCFKLEGIQAAGVLFEAMKGSVSIVKPAIEAMVALIEWEPVESLADKMDSFQRLIGQVVFALEEAADGFKLKGIQAASTLFEAMKGSVSIIKPAIEAILALTAWEPTQSLVDKMSAFQQLIGQVIFALEESADSFKLKGIQAASILFNAMKDSVAIIKPAIEAIQALTNWAPVESLVDKMDAFQRLIGQVVFALEESADCFELEGLQAASLLSEAMKGTLSIVKPGIEALILLGEYTRTSGLTNAIASFVMDLDLVVNELKACWQFFDYDGVDAAAGFYESAQKIVDIVKPAIEALIDLAAWEEEGSIPAKMHRLVIHLDTIIEELKKLKDHFVVEGVPVSFDWAESVNKMIGIIVPGIEAITTMIQYKGATTLERTAEKFKERLILLLQKLGEIEEQYTGPGVKDATAFAGAVKEMMSVVVPGLEAIKELMDMPLKGKFEQAAGIFEIRMNDLVQIMVDVWEKFGPDAIKGASEAAKAMTDISDMVTPALGALKRMAAYTQKTGLVEAMYDFRHDLYSFLQQLGEIRYSLYEGGGLANAEAFETAAGEVAAAAQAGVDSLLGIMSFRDWQTEAAHPGGAGETGMLGLANAVISALQTAIAVLKSEEYAGAAGRFHHAAYTIGQRIAEGISDGANLAAAIQRKLNEAMTKISWNIGPFYQTAYQLGANIANGIEAGFNANMGQLQPNISGGSAMGIGWYQHGLDAIISRPTLIGVGEGGRPEHVEVTPLGREGRATYSFGDIHIHQAPGDALFEMRALISMLEMGTVAP